MGEAGVVRVGEWLVDGVVLCQVVPHKDVVYLLDESDHRRKETTYDVHVQILFKFI